MLRRLNKQQLFGLTAIPFFLWFITAAIVFYKERVLYVDSAAQLFEMLLSADFKIYVSRYSMAINQILPWLLINVQAPISIVAIGYSVSMPIITATAFYLCLFRWKNLEAAFAILFSAALAQHTFFHAISETMLLVPYASMLYASCQLQLIKPKNTALFISEATVLLLLSMFIHPVSIFFIAFILWNAWLNKGVNALKKLWPIASVFALAFMGKMLLGRFSDATAHDDSFVSQLLENTGDILMLATFPSTISFMHLVKPMLWPIFLIISVGAIYYWRKKEIKIPLGNGLFIGLFLMVSLLIYRQGDSLIGMERAFLPLAFMAVLSVSDALLRGAKIRFLLWVVPLSLTFLSFKNIHRASPNYEQRLELLSDLVHQTKECKPQKFYWLPSGNDHAKLLSTWALSMETLLLSEINEGVSKVIFPHIDFIDPLLIIGNEPTIPFTTYQTLFYDDQLNRGGYFNIAGKLFPLLLANDTIKFAGDTTKLSVFKSENQKVLSKTKDNWENKTLSLAPTNPFQTVVEYSLLPKSNLSFSALLSPGATIVLDAGKNNYSQQTNNTEAWKTMSLEFQVADSATEVMAYVYNSTDTVVFAKNVTHTIYVPE